MEAFDQLDFADDYAVRAQNLTFCFGRTKALDNFNLRVKHGSVCGLIGNNGAGKTTAIHSLLGFLPPAAGRMSVLTLNPARQRVAILKRVGFFPEKVEPYDWMKVKTYFKIGAHSYPSWDSTACRDLARSFDLDTSKTFKQLTRGMLAKAKLIYALSHRPECLLLDEPISGLDPASRDELLSIIRDLTRRQNVTTLISSHSLYELADIATDICIIHQGRDLFAATMNEITHRLALLEIRSTDIKLPPSLDNEIIQTRTAEAVTQLLLRDKHHHLLQDFVNQQTQDVTLKEISLKEMFLFLTKEKLI